MKRGDEGLPMQELQSFFCRTASVRDRYGSQKKVGGPLSSSMYDR